MEEKRDGLPSRGRLALNSDGRSAQVGGRTIRLTGAEYQILAWLLARPDGYVATAGELFAQLWRDSRAASPRVVNVHICNLRRKLREAAGEDLIETVQGAGYRLV